MLLLVVRIACAILTVRSAAIDSVQQVAVAGDSVTMTCSTTIDADVLWTYSGTSSSFPHWVYKDGSTINGFRERFTVTFEEKALERLYVLVIRFLRPEDAGLYKCIEDGGIGPYEKQIQLIVQQEPSTTEKTDVHRSTDSTSTAPLNPNITEERAHVDNPVSVSVIIIAISTIGAVVLIACVVVVVVVIIRRRRQRNIPTHEKGSTESPQSTLDSNKSLLVDASHECSEQQPLSSNTDV